MTKIKINKEWAEAWLKLLRETPEEKHGFGKFYDRESDKYCAFGLLKILREDIPIDFLNHPANNLFVRGKFSAFILDLNDKEHLTFKEIADKAEKIIEKV